MVLRNIVRIDEEKCTGCGLCVPACAEGALKIIDGKAKLTSDKYCDGLGACLGECPQGAIIIEKREAAEFDEEEVQRHLERERLASTTDSMHSLHQSCPSAQVLRYKISSTKNETSCLPAKEESMLSQWPLQLRLVPSNAPFFENADILITADCVPFAYANFHKDFLKGKALVVGCPKLDDAELYKKKLIEIFKQHNIKSVTVVNMEVPCCFGLFHLVKEAINSLKKIIPLKQQIINIKGDKISNPVVRASR